MKAEATNVEIQKEEWEKKYSTEDYFRDSPSSLAQLVDKLIIDLLGKRIIELGCGQGQDAIFFGNKGAIVTALDFSQKAVESTRSRINKEGLNNSVSAMNADISSGLDFPQEHFDIIFANLSLHYFDDKTTKSIFDEVYRVLKPNGYLFFEVKSIDDVDYGRGEEIEKDFFNYNGKKKHFFSEQYLLECTRSFDVVCVQPQKYMSEGKLSSFLSACVQKPNYSTCN